jgi:hypothetical protein
MDIRPSPIAGTWYPADPEILASSVDRWLDEASGSIATEPRSRRLLGLLAPHAGHRFSGPVAGCAFACLRNTAVDTAIVISPWHRDGREPLYTTDHEAYGTPLGPVLIDVELTQTLDRMLQEGSGLRLKSVRRDREHAVEIELPFLQRVLPHCRLVSLMMGDQSRGVAMSLGDALGRALPSRAAVIIASSDLAHYVTQAAAERLDAVILDRVAVMDPGGLLDAERRGTGYACGAGAIAAMLTAVLAAGADYAEVLRHTTSGEVSGDTSSVVGYGAAAVWRGDGQPGGGSGHPRGVEANPKP